MLQQILQQPLPFETAAGHLIQSIANPSLDYFFSIITGLGNPGLWFLLAVFLYWKGDEKRALSIATVILFASAIVGILKDVTGRIRPSPEEYRVIAGDLDSNLSFPSGHATTITGIFGFYWEKFSGHARLLGILVVGLVMVSRVYLGVHFIGDVIVGASFGFVIGRGLHGLEKGFENTTFSQKKIIGEVGLVSSVALGLAVSLLFRPLGMGSGLLGFFAGAFAFKLMDMNSTKLAGKSLWAKVIVGFAVFGAIVYTGMSIGLEPEAYFIAGAWASLIYPTLYEKLARPSSTNQFEAPEPASPTTQKKSASGLGVTLKKKSRRK